MSKLLVSNGNMKVHLVLCFDKKDRSRVQSVHLKRTVAQQIADGLNRQAKDKELGLSFHVIKMKVTNTKGSLVLLNGRKVSR